MSSFQVHMRRICQGARLPMLESTFVRNPTVLLSILIHILRLLGGS